MKKQTGIRKEPYIGSFSSFSEKHTEQVTSVISQLRNPASAAVVTSENYALQEHYVREIVSNVFIEYCYNLVVPLGTFIFLQNMVFV